MIDPKLRLKWRRRFRKGKKQVAGVGSGADVQLERYVLRRVSRLMTVRRFVLTWVALLALILVALFVQSRQLLPYYQEVRAVPGGTFREGVLGSFTNANPLYASGSVDGAVSKLVFSSLFKYDEFNVLVGDLATHYEVDEEGTTYTVYLRDDVYWHDGEHFTAEDVVFTYQTISNPDARSPLFSSWRDTTVEAVDDYTVTFQLPSPFVAFSLAMTNGIVPQHVLEQESPSQLRSSTFNSVSPVGTGPFEWDTLEVVGLAQDDREERIALDAYADYHGGQPKLDRFIVRTFRSEDRLVDSFIERDVDAIAGLDSYAHEELIEGDYSRYAVPLTGQVGVFFKTNTSVLAERDIRQALVHAIDRGAVLEKIDGPVIKTDSPLLPIHQGYDQEITQLPYDRERATELLDEAGWQMGEAGVRFKDGQELSFSLVVINSAETRTATQSLQQQWSEIGVEVDVTLQDEDDLRTTIANHDFMALMHGISIGSDPDVFAFWHSSQADILADDRLNFSEYSSDVADAALESGRTRSDDELRSVKYKPFLEAWREDAPALMLYQPRFIYVAHNDIYGFEPILMNASTDRMYSAHEWMSRQQRVDKE